MATEKRPTGERERIIARRNAVLKLRIDGHSTRAIAEAYSKTVADEHRITATTVAEDLKALLKDLNTENQLLTAEYRELLSARNDQAYRAIAEQVRGGSLGAIDRLIKLNEQQGRLFGAFAPTKIAQTDPTGEQSISLSDDERMARLERLLHIAEQRQKDAEDLDDPAPAHAGGEEAAE